MAKYLDWTGQFIDANLVSGENVQRAARHRGVPKGRFLRGVVEATTRVARLSNYFDLTLYSRNRRYSKSVSPLTPKQPELPSW